MIVTHLIYSPASPLTYQSIYHSISMADWVKYHDDVRGGERKITLDERALELPGVRILRPHCKTSASSQLTRIIICGVERLAVTTEGFEYYEYILIYVDDILCISKKDSSTIICSFANSPFLLYL